MLPRPISVFALSAVLATAAFGQKSFDVATIKPNSQNDQRVMLRIQPGGVFSATGIPVRVLIMQAFDLRDFQISGGPGWMTSERWDIQAKAEGVPTPAPPTVFRPMLQSLLEERFQLKYHKETKEMPAYVLTAAKGGHKMKASETAAGGPPQRMFRMGRGQMNLQGTDMAGLAQALGQQLGRPVTDKTGITGNFEVELRWTPEPGQGGGPFGGPPPPEAIGNSDSNGPSLFTAVQEQLGLKLESQKGQVEILVIDSLSKPTEN